MGHLGNSFFYSIVSWGRLILGWSAESFKNVENERLIGLMRKKGWSIDRLAAESGVSDRTILSMRKGKYSPRLDSVILVCRALNCTINDVYPIEGEE